MGILRESVVVVFSVLRSELESYFSGSLRRNRGGHVRNGTSSVFEPAIGTATDRRSPIGAEVASVCQGQHPLLSLSYVDQAQANTILLLVCWCAS